MTNSQVFLIAGSLLTVAAGLFIMNPDSDGQVFGLCILSVACIFVGVALVAMVADWTVKRKR